MPAATLTDVRAKMMLLRSWQESGFIRTDDLEDRLVAGVIIDLEGIDDEQSGTSRKLPSMPLEGRSATHG